MNVESERAAVCRTAFMRLGHPLALDKLEMQFVVQQRARGMIC